MFIEWIINFVPEFASIGQNRPQILRNINFVPEFLSRLSKWSLRPKGLLVMLSWLPACCVVLYTYQKGSNVYKDQIDGNAKNSVFTFQMQFFCFSIFTPVLSLPSTLRFQSYPSKQSPTFLRPAKTFITFSSPKSSSSPTINNGFLKNEAVFG